jgi:hypothetical protein
MVFTFVKILAPGVTPGCEKLGMAPPTHRAPLAMGRPVRVSGQA